MGLNICKRSGRPSRRKYEQWLVCWSLSVTRSGGRVGDPASKVWLLSLMKFNQMVNNSWGDFDNSTYIFSVFMVGHSVRI